MPMILRRFIFFTLLFSISSFPLFAATPYVGGSSGFAFVSSSGIRINGTYIGDTEYDSGEAFSGTLGLDKDRFRLEGEVALQKNEVDNRGSDVSVFSLMASGYFDFDKEKSMVTPFVSAGVSYARVDMEYLGENRNDGVVALQLGAGLGVRISSAVTLDAKYRYFYAGNPEIELGTEIRQMDINSHNILLGFRGNF